MEVAVRAEIRPAAASPSLADACRSPSAWLPTSGQNRQPKDLIARGDPWDFRIRLQAASRRFLPVPAATLVLARTVLAHLIDLAETGLVVSEDERWRVV